MEAVTAVLAERMQPSKGLDRMVWFSIGAHVLLVVALLLMPAIAPEDTAPRTVMEISLGGAPGPRAGGMTPMGGRTVQAPQPIETVRRPVPAAPAPKTPEMTMPAPAPPKPRPAPKTPPVREAPPQATARTPSQGAEPQTGSATADTGAKGMGFGLTTGGGGTGGYLDVGNFCCPEYLTTMLSLIQRNWNSRQQVAGQAVVKFTIQRDGRITDVEVERPSGYFALDQTAQRALLMTRQLPPLPAQFTEPQLTVHLIFRYER